MLRQIPPLDIGSNGRHGTAYSDDDRFSFSEIAATVDVDKSTRDTPWPRSVMVIRVPGNGVVPKRLAFKGPATADDCP